MHPQISVVLPVWNAEDTVLRAVQSILNQTLSAVELIVVDDGSTDLTSQRLAEISSDNLLVCRTEHQGVAAAANLGLQRATAPLIARMDADDIAHPERLGRQLAFLHQHRLDAVGTRVQIESTNGPITDGMRRYEGWINEETVTTEQIHALRFVELPLVNPSILARRTYFEPGFSDNEFPEDYDLMLRAVHAGLKLGKTSEVLMTWVDSPGRLTRTHARYTDEAFMACRRFHLLRGPLSGVQTVDLWGAGQTGKSWLRWLQEQGIAVRQLIDVSVRKRGQTIHGVQVIAPESVREPDGNLMLVAVGADGARSQISEFVTDRGFHVGQDVWFVA